MSGFVNSTSSNSPIHHAEDKHKMYGHVIGVVTNNNDPQNCHRVQVRLPHLEGGGEDDKNQQSTWWARVLSHHAGGAVGSDNSHGPRGTFFLPEVGDEVIVAFEHGDTSRPLIIGSVFSDVPPDHQPGGGDTGTPNPPPYHHGAPTKLPKTQTNHPAISPNGATGSSSTTNTNTQHAAGQNDLKGTITRSGLQHVYNDNKDGPAMYLQTPGGSRIALVDGGKQGIQLKDPAGNYVWLKSGSASGDIDIFTAGDVNIKAKNINLKSTGGKITTDSSANTEMTVRAALKIATTGDMDIGAKTGTIHTSAVLNIKGNSLNLN